MSNLQLDLVKIAEDLIATFNNEARLNVVKASGKIEGVKAYFEAIKQAVEASKPKEVEAEKSENEPKKRKRNSNKKQ